MNAFDLPCDDAIRSIDTSDNVLDALHRGAIQTIDTARSLSMVFCPSVAQWDSRMTRRPGADVRTLEDFVRLVTLQNRQLVAMRRRLLALALDRGVYVSDVRASTDF